MTKINQEREAQASEDAGLDHALDAALARYAAVEPRLGLEDRILANLRAEPAPAPPLAWWRWGWAVAAAVAVIISLAVWKSARSSHPVVAKRPTPVERQAPEQAAARTAPLVARNKFTPKLAPRSSNIRFSMRPHRATAVADPKLDVFPSPQPLTEEEQALAQYVRNFPTDAKQVAQAQEASEREVLAKMQALANKSGESN